MRYDEIRSHVERVLRREFEHRFAEIGEKGPRDTYTPDHFDAARAILSDGAEAYWKRMGEEGARDWLGKVAQSAGISPNELEPDRVQTLKLLHAGIRAVVNSLEGRTEAVHAFELLPPPEAAKAAPEAAPGLGGPVANVEPGETLAEVADLFIREQVRVGAWVGGTHAKREAMLAVLTELLGAATQMNAITKKDAQEVKSVLFDLPANKNKHPEARDLTLRDAAKLTGLPKLSARTLNDYLGTFHTFTTWAAKNGYAKEGLFEGMNVNAGRGASVPDQVRVRHQLLWNSLA